MSKKKKHGCCCIANNADAKVACQPSMHFLECKFFEYFHLEQRHYALVGNGPFLNVIPLMKSTSFIQSRHFLTGGIFGNLKVFVELPVTVRGIINMVEDGYVIAFGDTYLAIVCFGRIFASGTLCASRVVSTGRFVVGGRRTGVHKAIIFYADGSFETIDFCVEGSEFQIKRDDFKRINLNGSQITAHLYFHGTELLGTSFGEIFDTCGNVYYSPTVAQGRSSVVQMVGVIHKNTARFLLALNNNGSISFHDLRKRERLSTICGRFTSLESKLVPQETCIVAGDRDGQLHSLKVDLLSKTLRKLCTIPNTSRQWITSLLPTDGNSLLVSSRMGQMLITDKKSFMDERNFVIHSGVHKPCRQWVYTTFGFYKVIGNRLFYSVYLWPPSKCKEKKRMEVWRAEHMKLRYYRSGNTEIVFAYNKYRLWFYWPEKTPIGLIGAGSLYQRKTKTLLSVVAADYCLALHYIDCVEVFIRNSVSGKIYKVCFDGSDEEVSLENKSAILKTIAIDKIESENDHELINLAMSFTNGKFNTYENISIPTDMVVGSIRLNGRRIKKHFIVSVHMMKNRLMLLHATGLFSSYYFDGPVNPCPNREPEQSINLSRMIGRGYALICNKDVLYAVGFKQNYLNIYDVLHNMHLISLLTNGPRSHWQVTAADKSTVEIIYSYGKYVLERRASNLRLSIQDCFLSGPVTVSEWIFNDTQKISKVYFGDAKGGLSVMRIVKEDTTVRKYWDRHVVDGAVRCVLHGDKFVYVGTSQGSLYAFRKEPCSEREWNKPVTTFPTGIEGLVSRMGFNKQKETEHLTFFLSNGSYGYISIGDFYLKSTIIRSTHKIVPSAIFGPVKKVQNFAGREISGPDKGKVKAGFVIALDKDGYLQRYHPSTNNIISKSKNRFSAFFLDSVSEIYEKHRLDKTRIFAGGVDGRVYFIVYIDNISHCPCDFFLCDQYHSQEIIALRAWALRTEFNTWVCLASLDISGLLVLRKMLLLEGENRPVRRNLCLDPSPQRWHSAVPHPRTLVALSDVNEIIVAGDGIETFSYI